jgi:hypothetical protein
MTEADRRRIQATAYHEAGHAAMRLELGRRLAHVTIKPDDESLGHILKLPTKLDVEWFDQHDWRIRRWAETEIMTLLAGGESERRLTGRRNNPGARFDERQASEVAMRSEGEGDRAHAYLRWLRFKVADWVVSPLLWQPIEAIAAALIDKETMTGAEVRDLFWQVRRAGLSPELVGTLERMASRPRPKLIETAYEHRGWTIRRGGDGDGNRRWVIFDPDGQRAIVTGAEGEQSSFATIGEAADIIDANADRTGQPL